MPERYKALWLCQEHDFIALHRIMPFQSLDHDTWGKTELGYDHFVKIKYKWGGNILIQYTPVLVSIIRKSFVIF